MPHWHCVEEGGLCCLQKTLFIHKNANQCFDSLYFLNKAVSKNMSGFPSFLSPIFHRFQLCKRVKPHFLCNLAVVEKV